jgi:exodeoxyribonuclease VIII
MKENKMYHADVSRISKSGLDLIAKCPAKYWHKYLDPNREQEKKTEALIVGNAFHVLTLEADIFPHHFIVKPKFSGTGSVAKREAFELEHADKEIITMEQYDQVRRMRDSVLAHPIAAKLLSDGFAERVNTWTDPRTDAPCKSRMDWFNTKMNFIVDLKSTEDASSEGFSKSSFKYRYHVQAPFYFDGAVANRMQPNGFIFIAVEKNPPYLANLFYMEDEVMDFGRSIYRSDLATYMECRQNNKWPGYDQAVKPLKLPSWIKL